MKEGRSLNLSGGDVDDIVHSPGPSSPPQFYPGVGMGDLKSSKAIYAKAALFLVMVLICAVLLLFEEMLWRRAFFVVVLIWSSARLYYFMFYVIEKYVDPGFRFSGVFDFLKYLVSSRSGKSD